MIVAVPSVLSVLCSISTEGRSGEPLGVLSGSDGALVFMTGTANSFGDGCPPLDKKSQQKKMATARATILKEFGVAQMLPWEKKTQARGASYGRRDKRSMGLLSRELKAL